MEGNDLNKGVKGQLIVADWFTSGTMAEAMKVTNSKRVNFVAQGYKPTAMNSSGVLLEISSLPLAYYDVPTLNKQIFEKALWQNLRSNTDIVTRMQVANSLWGEPFHNNNVEIHLPNVSHKVTDFSVGENNLIIGGIRILDTPMGNILYTLMQDGSVGFSSRGWGDLKDAEGGNQLVVSSSYIHVCWDAVAVPAVPESVFRITQSLKNLGLADSILSQVGGLQNLPAEYKQLFNSLREETKKKYYQINSSEVEGWSDNKDLKEGDAVKVNQLKARRAGLKDIPTKGVVQRVEGDTVILEGEISMPRDMVSKINAVLSSYDDEDVPTEREMTDIVAGLWKEGMTVEEMTSIIEKKYPELRISALKGSILNGMNKALHAHSISNSLYLAIQGSYKDVYKRTRSVLSAGQDWDDDVADFCLQWIKDYCDDKEPVMSSFEYLELQPEVKEFLVSSKKLKEVYTIKPEAILENLQKLVLSEEAEKVSTDTKIPEMTKLSKGGSLYTDKFLKVQDKARKDSNVESDLTMDEFGKQVGENKEDTNLGKGFKSKIDVLASKKALCNAFEVSEEKDDDDDEDEEEKNEDIEGVLSVDTNVESETGVEDSFKALTLELAHEFSKPSGASMGEEQGAVSDGVVAEEGDLVNDFEEEMSTDEIEEDNKEIV